MSVKLGVGEWRDLTRLVDLLHSSWWWVWGYIESVSPELFFMFDGEGGSVVSAALNRLVPLMLALWTWKCFFNPSFVCRGVGEDEESTEMWEHFIESC